MRRDDLLARLRAKADRGQAIIGAGAGTGLSAKCAEAGGADLIIIYNSGRYRMAGRGSLAGLMPYGDANAIVTEMAAEVLPVVRQTPVLAGVCGTDPFRIIPHFLEQLSALGFAGVQNFPTVGLIDGVFRQNLEETGMGFDLEVEMIRLAAERGLVTCPYVFDPEQAAAMARAGADVLVAHMGLTTSGTIGARTALTLDECVGRVQAMRDAADARQAGHPGAVPRRPDRRAAGRRVRAGPHHRRLRLLRGLVDGAAARRARADRPGPRVHRPVDRLMREK